MSGTNRHHDHERAANAIRELLSACGFVNHEIDGTDLAGTPDRVARAFAEMLSGYDKDPKAILGTAFPSSSPNIVVARNVEFSSMCEHHLLPFSGVAHVAYLPKTEQDGSCKVVGISKLMRLVDCFARRLQLQERLCEQIADAIAEELTAAGVAVVISASHSCVSCRGVLKQKASLVTSSLRGLFADDPLSRQEVIELIKLGGESQ